MASKKSSKQQYLKGCEDIQRSLSHISNEHKKERAIEWLRQKYSKSKREVHQSIKEQKLNVDMNEMKNEDNKENSK